MFAALCLARAPRRGMMGPVLDRLMPRRGVVTDKSLFDGEYRLVTVFPVGDRINWREVARLAGDLSENLVLPDGITPPDSILPFCPARFTGRLVANTAVELMRRSELQLYRRTVGIVDLNGIYQELVSRLLPHCLSVKIFTQRPGRYEAFSDRVLESYGVPLMISNNPDVLADCVLAVDPDGVCPQTRALYTITAAQKPGKGTVSHLRAAAPGAVDPANGAIDAHLLLAALYELSGSETAGALWASELRLSGRLMSFEGLSREFDRLAAKIAL